MPKLTGAQFLADSLAAYEVTHVFFVPAILSHTLAELDKRTDIKRIMTHGEKAAVYMADGYARATGRPGVSFAQCIGAANLAAGLRDPWLACSPMVVLTGGPYAESRQRHFYQQIDDQPLFRPLTKSSARVDIIARLPDAVRQAFRDATTGTPGPAHIELAGHLGELEQEQADLEVIVEDRFRCVPAFRSPCEPESLRQAAQLLAEAQRPILIAGGGARYSGAGPELRELAERLNIPVATSMNAKDILPANHPLNVGVPGQYSRKSANQAVLEADLVFFVGSHTGSQVTFKWQIPRWGTKVIQLDINAAELGRHYPTEVSLLGDAKTVLRELLSLVESENLSGNRLGEGDSPILLRGPVTRTQCKIGTVPGGFRIDSDTAARRQPWVQRVQAFSQAWRDEWREMMHCDSVPIRPERLCRELNDWLPPDALVVAETGHAGMWTAAFLDLSHPSQSFIRAAGSLGWGLPACLGAKLACPDRPVVLFSGDGGFWYHLSELETAARWNINAILIVNNNRSLNMEIGIFADAYGGKLERKHAELWKFTDVSFAAVAESLGVVGIRVDRPGDLRSALDRALAANRPCVVEVMTDIDALAPLAFLGC